MSSDALSVSCLSFYLVFHVSWLGVNARLLRDWAVWYIMTFICISDSKGVWTLYTCISVGLRMSFVNLTKHENHQKKRVHIMKCARLWVLRMEWLASMDWHLKIWYGWMACLWDDMMLAWLPLILFAFEAHIWKGYMPVDP